MPKSRTNLANDYDAWVKKDRGQGEFENYQPWLTIRDVKSRVGGYRIWSQKFHRVIHTMSFGELIAFLLLEWDDNNIDVREQYPLDPLITRDICEKMQVVHPGFSGNEIVMTSDFLVTKSHDGVISYKAYQIKYSVKEIREPRTNTKLQIEQEYWYRKNIPFAIWLSSKFSPVVVSNFKLLLPFRTVLNPWTDEELQFLQNMLREVISAYPEFPFTELDEKITAGEKTIQLNDALKMMVALRLCSYPVKDKLLTKSKLGDFKINTAEGGIQYEY